MAQKCALHAPPYLEKEFEVWEYTGYLSMVSKKKQSKYFILHFCIIVGIWTETQTDNLIDIRSKRKEKKSHWHVQLGLAKQHHGVLLFLVLSFDFI